MYATTYVFDESDDRLLIEIVVIDDLIFYSNGEYPRWYVTNSCVLGKIFITTYDLSIVINDGYLSVRSRVDRRAPRNICAILHSIYKTYSLDEEEPYFQTHQLDDRWDGIANRIRAELY